MKQKEPRGITLVALVVTVVLLLILASITITAVFDDNGIIKKSQEAADKTNESQTQEKNDIKDLAGILDDAMITTARLGKKVPDNTLYANFTAKTADNKDIKVPIPGGYRVVENTQKSNKIDDGIVIQDDLGNEFVWVPVSSEQFNRMYDSVNKRGNLYDFGTSSAPKTPPTLKIYSANGYREPDILTDIYNGDAVTEDETKGIEQLKTVVGISTTGEGETEKDKVLNNWKKELEDKFNEMIASVEKYKGFYIGRYETGSWTTNKNNVPKVQKGQTVGLIGANWYYQYEETRNLKANNNVITSMIWGCQIDRTLEWIAQTNKKDEQPDYSLLTDSSSWGNYSNYKTVTNDSTTESGKILPSGTNPNWQKNNIFDLVGNAWDWTLEAGGSYGRTPRGGSCGGAGSSYPASFRTINFTPGTVNYTTNSSRSTLYISTSTGS